MLNTVFESMGNQDEKDNIIFRRTSKDSDFVPNKFIT